MPKKKINFEDWKESKEYIMWSRLKESCDKLELNGGTFISLKDLGGFYWEPLLELIYKFANIIKKTSKLKELKMDWLRPLNYLGAQSDIEVIFDGDKYLIPKYATNNAASARFDFQHLLEAICNFENINDTNFLKEYKNLTSCTGSFFKNMYIFVFEKDENGISGYRYLIENIKTILYPLRMLRKSAYRLFSVEKNESMFKDLRIFQDKPEFKTYYNGVCDYLETETYKQKRDCDINELDKYMGKTQSQGFYEYKFRNEILKENDINKKNDDKGNNLEDKKIIKKGKRKATMRIEEKENEDNIEKKRKNLALINITELKEQEANPFVKDALQKDFENGFDLMFKFLNKKMSEKFPFTIESHKMFVNLNKIPEGLKTHQIKFYLGQLHQNIEDLKILCYEMKLNGLTRVKIPIQSNIEFIDLLKKIYDLHNIIDRILGDKLLYEQYMFIYDCINFINNSALKEELEIIKNKKLIEFNIPRYIFLMSMIKSANIFQNFQKNSRKNGNHFTIDQYYQPTKHEIDSENNITLNAYEIDDKTKKKMNPEIANNEKLFWEEVNNFGRFWLLEGYFPPDDRNKWLEAIEILSNVNKLVQDDIRDTIILGNEEKYIKEENKEENNNENNPKRNSKSNKFIFVENAKLKSNKKINNSSTNDDTPNEYNDLIAVRANSKRQVLRKTSKNNLSNRKNTIKSTIAKKSSCDSIEAQLMNLPKNGNNLRPPNVWNYPINRIEDIREKLKNNKREEEKLKTEGGRKKVLKDKSDKKGEDLKKSGIRKVNPFICYHDLRLEKFIELFNELYNNAMDYSKKKGNIWEYCYCKILAVFGIIYTFTEKNDE